MSDPIDAFIDPISDALEVVDRSTLERFAECNRQGAFSLQHATPSTLEAESGNAVHEAISLATRHYIDADGEMSAPDLADVAKSYIFAARPDIQPDAVSAFMPAVWSVARMITGMSADNILRHDGGEGRQSGQLAWDLDDLGLRITSELDLLHAGPSPEVLHEIDYKTGWRRHDIDDIESAFQFQLHAWLVLLHYPDVQALRVRVWDTRRNLLTHSVEFSRQQLPQYAARVYSVARLFARTKALPPEHVPAWPDESRCSWCPYVIQCDAATSDVREFASNPVAAVHKMAAMQRALDKMTEIAGVYVEQHGDIVTGEGDAFGTGKPVSVRRKIKQLYRRKNNETDS